MATVEIAKHMRMTEEEFLALPDNGVRRWLVDGEVRESGMTVRNWQHASILMQLAIALGEWWKKQPAPRGRLVGGEAGIRLAANRIVGVDVAYVPPDVMAKQGADTTLIEGVPSLVVEILSPNDKLDDIEEKVDLYLKAGVPLIWSVNPKRRTVTVYRPDKPVQLLTEAESLSGDEILVGLAIPVRQLFE